MSRSASISKWKSASPVLLRRKAVAVPFGGHPSLRRYLEWARENGCTAEEKLRTHAITGQPYRSLEISGPAGGHVVLVNPDLEEHLAPSTVTYLNRRLGVKSPFPATPEQPNPSETEYVREDLTLFDPREKGEPTK
jgi:hypothetical protein